MSNDTNANLLETGNDETERLALEECIKRQRFDRRVSVLVIPAGRCELAIKFARLGAQVVAADLASWQHEIDGRILANGQQDHIAYLEGSISDFPESPPGDPFDIIVIRRGLCSMPYEQARQVVRQLALIKKYDITGQVCLYSERNLFMLLLNAGASVLRTMTTTHGNVKAVAVRV